MKKFLLSVISVTAIVGAVLLSDSFVSAAICNPKGTSAEQAACAIGNGDGGTRPKDDKSSVDDLIPNIIKIMLLAIGIGAVVMIIYGGIRYTISRGDSKGMDTAKNTIIWAVVGLVVSMVAFAIVNFVFSATNGSGGGSGSNPDPCPTGQHLDAAGNCVY